MPRARTQEASNVNLWQRRAAYYAAQETLTDEQRADRARANRTRTKERRAARPARQIVPLSTNP